MKIVAVHPVNENFTFWSPLNPAWSVLRFGGFQKQEEPSKCVTSKRKKIHEVCVHVRAIKEPRLYHVVLVK